MQQAGIALCYGASPPLQRRTQPTWPQTTDVSLEKRGRGEFLPENGDCSILEGIFHYSSRHFGTIVEWKHPDLPVLCRHGACRGI